MLCYKEEQNTLTFLIETFRNDIGSFIEVYRLISVIVARMMEGYPCLHHLALVLWPQS